MTDQIPTLPEIPDEALITDPSQFEALNSTLRMRILKRCHEPLSVRQLAEGLDMPVTRLYYHVNLLEESGFLQVVHTRKSGARLEKLYRIAGKSITPGPDLAANVTDPAAAAKVFAAIVIEPARVEAEAALTNRLGGDERHLDMGRTLSVLSPAEAKDLGSRINDLVQEFMAGKHDSDDPEARGYAFTYTLLPSDL